MSILKRTPKPVSALVRLSLFDSAQDPDETHPADLRPALAFTDSGQIEMARHAPFVSPKRAMKDCGCGKKAKS